GNIVGLERFFTQRTTTLNGVTELTALGPAIASVQASSDTPTAADPVWITSAVAGTAGSTVAKVELFYRPSSATTYQRAAMRDDGLSNDGAAGDGVYGVRLPVV